MAATAEALRDLQRGDPPPALTLVPPIKVRDEEPQRHAREFTDKRYLSDRHIATINMVRSFLAGTEAQIVGQRLRQFTGKPSVFEIFVAGDQRGALMGGKIQKVDEGNGRVKIETVFSYSS